MKRKEYDPVKETRLLEKTLDRLYTAAEVILWIFVIVVSLSVAVHIFLTVTR